MINPKKYHGIIVPMVTPFRDDFSVDTAAAGQITEFLIDNGVIPFILGTTGESHSMSSLQKEELVRAVMQATGGRSEVYAGISGNSLIGSIEQARIYADMGVGVVVASLPFYYPIVESQMISWFEQLADAVPVPLILYNIPITVKLSIPLEVLDRLSYHPNIVGVKDSEKDIKRIDRSLELWKERKDFSYLVGWGMKAVYGMRGGADGVVPSAANLIPGMHRKLLRAVENMEIERAEELQETINRISALYLENRNLGETLVALKVLMYVKGFCEPHMLPPLYRMKAAEEEEYIKRARKEFELLGV
jgi:4-hydroxy-tetrahydrodipicolinate synthase